MRAMVPPYVWSLVEPYGLTPTQEELPRVPPD
jgi:hypothetical protein